MPGTTIVLVAGLIILFLVVCWNVFQSKRVEALQKRVEALEKK